MSGGLFASQKIMLGLNYNQGTFLWGSADSNTTVGSATLQNHGDLYFPKQSLGLFLDLIYARIDISLNNLVYAMDSYTISNGIKIVWPNIVAKGFLNVSFLDLSVIGKLPIEISPTANFWIGAGLQYSINLRFDPYQQGTNIYTYGPNDSLEGRDLNDLYGIIAAGFTLDINESFAIVPMFTFKYNFTPYPVTDAYIKDPTGANQTNVEGYKADNICTMYQYDIGIGIAYKF